MEPPIPYLPPFLPLSLFFTNPLSLSLPPLPFFLTAHPRPGEGADSSQRPSLSKRACYSAPSLWDRRKTHMHTHTYRSADMHTHRTCFHKGLVHNTHPRTLSLPLICTQKYCSTPYKILAHTKTFDCSWMMFCLLSAFLKMCWHFACTNQDQIYHPYRH